MSYQNKSIRAIRDAEEQAAMLCKMAEDRAKEMRDRVHTEGEAHCAEVTRTAEEEVAATLAEVRRRAAAIREKKRSDAMDEAARLTMSARENMDDAVSHIVWEIIEKCQSV